jgi:hypothetical protein
MATPIFAAGPLPAPVVYTVPGSSEIVPLSAYADYDGTNASGDFVPTLIFRDQAGNIIGQSQASTTVAAGASASMSWFPGVKAAAAAVAGSSGMPWANTNGSGLGQSIGSGLGPVYFSVQDTGGTARFSTSDTSIFANASTTLFTGSPVYGIQINAPGTYMVQGAGFWLAQGTTGRGISHYYSASAGSAPSVFQFGRTDSLTGDNWAHAGAAPGLPHMSFYDFLSVSAAQVGAVLAGYASVQSGGASTVASSMMIFQLSSYVGTKL